MAGDLRETSNARTTSDQHNLTRGLNPPQAQAVVTTEGPLLILAGAGSGKTRVLTHRFAHLLASGRAAADEILAVTFTNKAAREMESRIVQLVRTLGHTITGRLWISTFHSICARLLRDQIHLLDYQSHFAIYDPADQLSVIRKVCTALQLDDKAYPAKNFASRINSLKTDGWTIEDVDKGRFPGVDERTRNVYRRYEEEMKRANALDFGDLLIKTHELFQLYPALLEQYQCRFRYLMVDEYQDTNRIQYLIVQQLASAHRNLCVVGDEDQSIYSWRGADIHNILDFEKDFPEAVVIKLEQNYRSSQTIVRAATEVIRNNTQRKDKTLFTERDKGEPILIREENNEYDEARFVVSEIQRDFSQGRLASDIAVFYRTNAQSRTLEEQLRSRSLPYQIVGGIKFYERMEIKDLLSYLRLLLNRGDDVALKRVINVPARGIGKTTLDRLDELSLSAKQSLWDTLQQAIDGREFHSGVTRKLRDFVLLMEGLVHASQGLRVGEIYQLVLERTGYLARLREEDTPEAEARIENLDEFYNAITRFTQERGDEATLQSFLEEMALVSDADQIAEKTDDRPKVTLMTLHISKGLEFPVVYIVGLEEGIFPSGRAIDSAAKTELEEERRLAYVGMTRAEQRLTLTHARTRRVWGSEQMNPPSRFLKEIPTELTKVQSAISRPRFMSQFDRGAGRTPQPQSDFGDSMPSYEEFSDSATEDAFDHEDSFSSGRANAGLGKGLRVRHPTFGLGQILSVDGSGDQARVSVVFADHTVKKFVAKYARLEVV
jgi:DNA helicase-2/ATP-dependent DNA helicase PcrA